MHEVCFPRRSLESTKPSKNLAVIAMSGKTVDHVNLGANRIVLAENANLPRAFGKKPPARAIGLEADKHDAVSFVGQSLTKACQM